MEKVDYTEIVFTISPKDVDRAGDIANMAVKGGIYIEDYTNLEQSVEEIAHIDLIDSELLKKDRSIAKIHIYLDETENPAETIAYISEMYKANGIDFSVDTSMCLYEDWAENWKKYFKPINIGERLVIRPAWEPETAQNGRTELILEPGMAFGTGTHETTRLCLELLSKYTTEQSEILDVGTGSGILAVAGVLLGAKSRHSGSTGRRLRRSDDRKRAAAGRRDNRFYKRYSHLRHRRGAACSLFTAAKKHKSRRARNGLRNNLAHMVQRRKMCLNRCGGHSKRGLRPR